MGDKTLPTGLIGGIEKRVIEIFDYDPLWPVKFREQANRIAKALGDAALQIEHIGSTSVPGLAAKPIIDVLLVVNEAGDEAAYLPALEAAGYVLRVREPDFYEHRMFRTPELDVHLHVFSKDSPEIERYLDFRNQLRTDEDDRKAYETVKRKLVREDWTDMNAYADAKTEVIEKTIAKKKQLNAQRDGRAV